VVPRVCDLGFVLHVFDMDGTLLAGTTAPLLIAEQSGTVTELRHLEGELAASRLTTAEFAEAVHRLWSNVDAASVRAAFDSGTWMGGIPAVLDDIRRRGEQAMVITMSPDFFAELLLEWGFDLVEASQFPPMPFPTALDTAGVLAPDDKPRLVESYCRRRGIAFERCVAYGDSMSDEPLFALLDHTVAVNASATLEQMAAVSYRGDNMWAAYQCGRRLLDQTT
jgi:phosphoserine phosphatase